jgi:hypothetical protein
MRRNVAIIAVAACSHLIIVDAQCNLTGSWTGSGSGQPGPLIEVGEPSDACMCTTTCTYLTALHCSALTHTRHPALAHPPPVHHAALHCTALHSLTHAAHAVQYSPTHSLILSLVRSLDLPTCTPTHPPTHPPSHSLTHSTPILAGDSHWRRVQCNRTWVLGQCQRRGQWRHHHRHGRVDARLNDSVDGCRWIVRGWASVFQPHDPRSHKPHRRRGSVVSTRPHAINVRYVCRAPERTHAACTVSHNADSCGC